MDGFNSTVVRRVVKFPKQKARYIGLEDEEFGDAELVPQFSRRSTNRSFLRLAWIGPGRFSEPDDF